MTKTDLNIVQLQLSKLDLCGCGSGSEFEIVVLLLDRAKRNQDQPKFEFDESLSFYAPCEDASGRWMEFGAKVLDGAGMLEHGTGIGCAWLTDEGNLFLQFLQEYGTDTNKWPEGII